MKKIIYMMLAVSVIAGSTSCVGSLDQYPHSTSTANDVYTSAEGYQQVLSGIYAAFIQRISSVSSEARSQNYLRTLTMFQDCSTDSCDPIWLFGETLTDVNGLSWTASNMWCSAMYYHIYNIVAMCNDFISSANNEDLLSRLSESDRARVEEFKSEARFLRAYAYSHAIDFYNKMPFVTEADGVGSYIPQTYDRSQMFGFLVQELSEIAETLDTDNYGHATRGAAYALLARIYLNGETWTGTPYYTECISACKKVLEEGYGLEDDYSRLFNGDNHLRAMKGGEIIFTLACDGTYTTTWDATTFLVCGQVLDGFADAVDIYGNDGAKKAWNNLRARPQLADSFEYGDSRNLIIAYDRKSNGDGTYSETDRSKDITAHDDATTGYRIYKWTNTTDSGEPASFCGEGGGADTDFPVLRLAEVYLMIGEAFLRGGEGVTRSEALGYVNEVRTRAFGSNSYNIGDSDFDLDFILDERLREFYLECIRRTDLIRFGRYTSGYNWQWKGNVQDGEDVDSKYRFLAIPEAEYSVNPNTQAINNELGF